MRTLIQGGDVVGFDGNEHRLIRDGVVVFEDATIVAVGRTYAGPVDRRIDARGMLICPGFINTHVHVGIGSKPLSSSVATSTALMLARRSEAASTRP